MTPDKAVILDPLAPIEKHSFACGVCRKLNDTENEARECALDDTKQITVEKILKRDTNGYPKRLNVSFRTGTQKVFAEVKDCPRCKGTGECHRPSGDPTTVFPCDQCDGTGWLVIK